MRAFDPTPRQARAGVAAVTAAVAAFLLARLTAWPPHEDETLALFVGRKPLGDLFQTVLDERGGAPLHYLFAWAVAHLGLGLPGLRLVSAAFAVASVPVIAALAGRLAGRAAGLVGAMLAAGSWLLLFQGIYGRMYSLFLFTSGLSYVLLLRARERGGVAAWSAWGVAVLAAVATQPYGALVLASQAAFVLLGRRRMREAAAAFAAVAVAGTPFWLTDLVLAGRFEVGVGGGGDKLGGPLEVLRYLWETAGDASSGYAPVLVVVLALAALGLTRVPREARLLTASVVGVPVLAFLAARLGAGASPESRHLIFALPVFATALAAGVLALPSRLAAVAVAGLLVAELAWAWQRTPALFEGEPAARVAARNAASAWLAATSRPDDILLGYDPLFLGGWERNARFPDTVLPRADGKLALKELRDLRGPLGRAVFVFDASDTSNYAPAPVIRLELPAPKRAFEARAFGPFLVIRTRGPVETPRGWLTAAQRAQLVGKKLAVGDADVNLANVNRASLQLAREERSSRSSVSR